MAPHLESGMCVCPPTPPPDDLAAWVRGRLGDDVAFVDRSPDHGENRVWEVRDALGGRSWLKQTHGLRQFRQEAWAHAHVVPWLLAQGVVAPAALGVAPEHQVLLLAHVEGQDGDALWVEASETRRLGWLRQAGAFLALLHRSPFPSDDPMPLDEALARRSAAWAERAAADPQALTADQVRALARCLADRSVFAGCERVVCHRDLSPRNWRVGPDDDLRFLDFGACRHDLWLWDLLALDLHAGLSDTASRWEAVVEGYGRALTGVEHGRLLRLRWFEATTTVLWARAHGDAPFEALGRRAVEAMRDASGAAPDW